MVDEGAAAAVRSGLLVAALTATGVGEVDVAGGAGRAGGGRLRRRTPRGGAAATSRPARRPRPRGRREGATRRAPRSSTRPQRRGRRRARGPHGGRRRRSTQLQARSLQLQAEVDELKGRIAQLESDLEENDDELADAEDVKSEAADTRRRDRGASWRAPRRRSRASAQSSYRPALRALDGVLPAGVRLVGGGTVAARLEAAVQRPRLAQGVGRVPHARCRGRPGTPHRGPWSRRSPAARRAARPGRPGAGTAGRWRRRHRRPAVRRCSGMVSSTSRTSKAMASRVARTMWARVVPRVMPMIRPRACGSQCGAPRPVSAGTNTTPSVSVDGRRDGRGLGRGADDLQPVAQPLHGRAGHEDGALEGVGQDAVGGAPGRRAEQPGVGALHRAPGVGQDERPGAVGALGVALVEAGLAEERRLLVARDAGDRQ